MKDIMMETSQECGVSKGSCRHQETWWWNEEVAEAVNVLQHIIFHSVYCKMYTLNCMS